MIEKKQFVLLLGATGKTGYHLANFLIEKRVPIRLVVRKNARVTELFGIKQVAFESVRECNDFTNKQGKEELRKAFEASQTYGPITHVVSALGASANSKQSTQKVEYDSQCTLIDLSKEFKVERYVLVSGALITKPWHPISLLLNIFMSNIYAHKANAENYLRRSGLSYVIVRPVGLKGSYEEVPPTDYTIGQGDKSAGTITRVTVAKLAVDSLLSTEIKSKVTFDCCSTAQQLKQPYVAPTEHFIGLAEDTEADFVKANHSRASATVKFLLLGALVYGVARLAANLEK